MGIYGIVRFSGWLPVPPAAGWVVIGLGAAECLVRHCVRAGAKRFQAAAGLLLGGEHRRDPDRSGGRAAGAVAWRRAVGPAGVGGGHAACLESWGVQIAVVFRRGLGAARHRHAGNEPAGRACGKPMPWTAGLFALGAVAVSGLPPLNGFVSEWMIYLGLFDATTSKTPSAWAAMPAAILLAMAGALALAAFVKAGLGDFPRRAAHQDRGESPRMRLVDARADAGDGGRFVSPSGWPPRLFWPAVSRAVGAWHPAWAAGSVARAVGHAGRGASGTGRAVCRRRRSALAESPGQRSAARSDLGLRLRGTHREDAIQQRLVRGHRGGLVCAGFCGRCANCGGRAASFRQSAIRLERVPETVLERVIGAGRRSASCGFPPPCAACNMAACRVIFSMWSRDWSPWVCWFCWEACHESRFWNSSSVSACWLLLAPLLPGIINKVKAWVAGRRGPPVLQLYYDLARLWRKSVVMSNLASPAFVILPAVAWVALFGAAHADAAGSGGRGAEFPRRRAADDLSAGALRGSARRGRRWKPARPSKAWARRGRSVMRCWRKRR